MKPWVIEAFNFIAASIHQDRGSAPPGLSPHLFNPAMLDGDDDAMEDDDDDDAGGPSPRGSGSRITREQLANALSALGGGSSSSSSSSGLPSSNAFGGLFQPTAGTSQPTSGTSRSNSGLSAAGANIQNLMNTLSGAAGGQPGQPLNSDLVARAVTEALRRLTPEQRADQLNAIRNFATQLQQSTSGSASNSAGTPVASQPPQTSTTPGSDNPSLSVQYQSQLHQMRDLGITDERLSILALRVSEGDVNTAAELIFSGWQGEGSDPVD